MPTDVPVVDDVVVAILTGARPELLARTLKSLATAAAERVHRWEVLALVNGADERSLKVLDRYSWSHAKPLTGPIRSIGSALSELMTLPHRTGRKFVLHLEDDWACIHEPSRWLDRAAFALQDPKVGQVRLRDAKEKVMGTHMLSRHRIRWMWARDHAYAENAHFTFNPTLMRVEDIAPIYPCKGETEAQAKFDAMGKAVVQLLPGSFRHLGTRSSLRMSLRRGHG